MVNKQPSFVTFVVLSTTKLNIGDTDGAVKYGAELPLNVIDKVLYK